MTELLETQSQPDQLESKTQSRKSSRKLLAFSVLALAINGTAAIYTMPSLDIDWPNVSQLAELLPHEKLSTPAPDPVVAALKDIRSTQEQHTASLQENSSGLHQNADLLQQDSIALVALRQSVTDEQVDIKNISSQLSKLMAKVDLLQNAIAPEITSSIPKVRARNRWSAAIHKRARSSKPAGPVSVGGAPLATAPAPDTLQSPEG